VVVGLTAAAVHGRSIAFDFIYLDDRDLIVEDRPFLIDPANLLRAFTRSYMHVVDGDHPYYRPLVTVSYALDAQWSGVHALGYHLTNVGLHVVASVLFFALLHRLALGPALSVVAALVFAVHPALVSAVSWIPGRNDSLMAVLALGAWLLLLEGATRPSRLCRLLHVPTFWLALAAKETAVMIPIVVVVHLALVEREAWARLWRSTSMPGLVAGWVAGIAGRWLLHPFPGDATAREAIQNVPVALMSLGQLSLPVNPSLLMVPEDLPVWPGLVAGILLVAATCFLPGLRPRVVVLGCAVFLLFLVPSLVVPGTLVLESRLYLPACGLIVAAAEIVRALALESTLLHAFSGVVLAALAGITLAYEGTFHDRRVFARAAIAAAPHSPLAHLSLGQTYQADGDADRALAEYRIALRLGSVHVVHNNIAVIHMGGAHWPEAERELREELAADPHYAVAYRNLAVVLRRQGRLEEAGAADERARQLVAGDRDTAQPASGP
jgi:hypothetical protein